MFTHEDKDKYFVLNSEACDFCNDFLPQKFTIVNIHELQNLYFVGKYEMP